MSKTIYIRFFGKLTDTTSTADTVLYDIADTDEAVERLTKQYPALKESTYVIAVDKRIINGNTSLDDRQTVAFMPPFSGG